MCQLEKKAQRATYFWGEQERTFELIRQNVQEAVRELQQLEASTGVCLKHVIQLLENVEKRHTSDSIEKLIKKVGIPANINGYNYIKYALALVQSDSKYKVVTKELYPEIARAFNTTPSRAERCIRYTVEQATKRNSSFMKKTFKGRPSNSEFIITLAQMINS